MTAANEPWEGDGNPIRECHECGRADSCVPHGPRLCCRFCLPAVKANEAVVPPEAFAAAMTEIASKEYLDTEKAHGDADELMCKVLASLGYHEGVTVFQRMEGWYA